VWRSRCAERVTGAAALQRSSAALAELGLEQQVGEAGCMCASKFTHLNYFGSSFESEWMR